LLVKSALPAVTFGGKEDPVHPNEIRNQKSQISNLKSQTNRK
jgi:hypothetical protein